MGGGIGGEGFDIEEFNKRQLETLEGEELEAFKKRLEEQREQRALDELASGDTSNIHARINEGQQAKIKELEGKISEFESGPQAASRGEVVQQMLSGQLEGLRKRREKSFTVGGKGVSGSSGRNIDGSPMASNILLGG